jgi:phosphate starvation-inducible protein PhoH
MALQVTLHPELTEKQRDILRNPTHFMILRGPAGTSKTYMAIARALKLLAKEAVEKIIIIRSAVETRRIGFLPGDQQEKLDVYTAPYVHLFNELSPKRNFRALLSSKEVEFHSTSYLRGVTFDDACIIVDEYQNMNKHELETIVTRVGVGTHLMLCGSSDQSDLQYAEASEHLEIIQTLECMEDFDTVDFTIDEIVRSAFVKRYYRAKALAHQPKFLRHQQPIQALDFRLEQA